MWASDTLANISFTVKGVTLKGTMALTPSTVDMDLDVPFLFRLFQKQAIKIIEEEIQEWIGKAKRGELD